MNESKVRISIGWWPVGSLLAVLLISFAPALVAQEDPVTFSTSGNARPNGTVRVALEINDGSTLESVSWEQTGGVSARLSGVNSATVRAKLAPAWRYRQKLFAVLAEPPIGADELPPNVPVPEGEFPGGLQNRWQVVGVNLFALEEAGLVVLEAHVTTSSGTYHLEVEVHTALPWKRSNGLNNVPVGDYVLLYGKDQASYDWQLTPPAGSSASLTNARGRNPSFLPDVPGTYEVTVTDAATALPVTLTIYAGTWFGVITGQDADGRPIGDRACTVCHSGVLAPDKFTPWAQTGHAEIFTQLLDGSTFSGQARCFPCHAVGYDLETANEGIDEASDYHDFLDSGLIGNPGDNWSMVLDDFPETARKANVQCESCHGPQNAGEGVDNPAHSGGFVAVGEPRVSLSANVCAYCHGEPLRHARFQQWQLSGHANYELAIDRSTSGNCSRCHTVNGFLKWVPILLDDDPATDPLDNITVDWTEDEAHPQTCPTCHDPHNTGTTSGNDPDVNIRISGDTPPLIAGFKVVAAGRGAMCMTCHNSRRGLRNDDVFDGLSDKDRASHGSAQTDVLMGENAFGVNVGVRGPHSLIVDTCVTCHMVATPPPDLLSYNQNGANHTFFASDEICSECHDEISAEVIENIVETLLADVEELIEDAYLGIFVDQIAAGNVIDIGPATITSAANVSDIHLSESRGRQALAITLGGTAYDAVTIGSIDVVGAATTSLVDAVPDGLLKAGWNWTLIHNDGSHGIHNPRYALSVLDAARDFLVGQGAGGARLVATELPWD